MPSHGTGQRISKGKVLLRFLLLTQSHAGSSLGFYMSRMRTLALRSTSENLTIVYLPNGDRVAVKAIPSDGEPRQWTHQQAIEDSEILVSRGWLEVDVRPFL